MNVKWISEINQGCVRESQEDSLGVWPRETPILFVVADGLGGHANGDIASQTAIDILLKDVSRSFRSTKSPRLKKAFTHINRSLRSSNQDKATKDQMATTLTALWFQGDSIRTAHVGDSRIYRLRSSTLKQLTRDHALDDHTLTQAVGLEDSLDTQMRHLKWREGDLYLICSDGLYDMVPDSRMSEILDMPSSLRKQKSILLEEALSAGGHDNISFVIIKIS